MKTLYLCTLTLLGMLCLSCNAGHNARSISQYINDPRNGLLQQTARQGLHVQIQYIPTDLQVLSASELALSGKELDSAREQYDSYVYFKLVLNEDATADKPLDAQYLNFGLTENFYLKLSNGNIVPCTFYQHIPTGDKHRHEFIVVFEKDTKGGAADSQDFAFVYDDKMFGAEQIAFNFSHKDLQNIPQL
jgi:hypothetical protein